MKKHHIEQSRWTLAALLPAHEGAEYDKTLAELEALVSEMEASRERLSPQISGEEFLALLDLSAQVTAQSLRVVSYAHLWFGEDTQNPAALGFLSRAEQLHAALCNRLLFFSLWWKGLDDEPALRLLAESGQYTYYLETLRQFKPYTLSEAEEKVINIKDVNGSNALVKLYQMITNRFSFQLEIDGEVRQMTRGELSVYYRDPRPELREAAYRELYRVYAEESAILAQIYGHVARDWDSENVDLRGFSSPIAVRNLHNDVPDAVVETLLESCRRNMSIFYRYFRLKAQWLGIERLRRYDLYAPIQAAEKSFPFSEAADLVLDCLHQFAPVLAGHAQRVFAEQHLDSEVRVGKRSGAFCASVLPGMTPWVLTNYQGKTDDVLTLAHEIGHAVHAMMAQDHPVFTFHSTLPLAETASVFSEMLLVDRWLAEESDPAARRDLLVTVIDEAYATIARQAYFVLFENQAHPQALAGATADEMGALYLQNLHEQFGDAVDVSDEFRWEWIAIPHLYRTPFYCYAYSFGHLLVLALYKQYKEEGASFIPRYLKILGYGGSASPAHIVGEAGFDMASPAFWQGGFDVLTGLLDELEAL
ncbi:MAG: M3 family oligoendopeptidase [Anaerolineae bacterium]|nr:M3 family oligoendopeptidase [Anaerolineae bacterium]